MNKIIFHLVACARVVSRARAPGWIRLRTAYVIVIHSIVIPYHTGKSRGLYRRTRLQYSTDVCCATSRGY